MKHIKADEYIRKADIEKHLHREEHGTPDERWRPESEFAGIIDCIPAVDVVEVKRGEWIVKNTERRKVFYCSKRIAHCPYCGHMEDRKIPKFCSECGADLRGEAEAKEDEKK